MPAADKVWTFDVCDLVAPSKQVAAVLELERRGLVSRTHGERRVGTASANTVYLTKKTAVFTVTEAGKSSLELLNG